MDVDQRNNKNNNSTIELVNADEVTFDKESISYPATNIIRGMLRELLTLPDYSITRVATELHISSATVRRLLQGNTLQPSVRTFDKIIRLYCSVCHEIYAHQRDQAHPDNDST